VSCLLYCRISVVVCLLYGRISVVVCFAVFVANISSGDTVLVHAAGSGVGTAILQLLHSTVDGVTTLVTAGRHDKLELAKQLGARDAFNYKHNNFAEKVLSSTEGSCVRGTLC